MLTKPLYLVLVFLLAICNFAILLLPLGTLSLPFFILAKDILMQIAPNLFFFLAFCVSGFMLVYLFFDLIFGFTIRSLSRGATGYKKALQQFPFPGIEEAFKETKKRFNTHNVFLYIDTHSDVVNAYAISSMRRKRIILTLGLLATMYKQAKDDQEFTDAIRGILGHEMSHLVNKDFLPGLLLSSNHAAHRFLSRILQVIFIIAANLFGTIPFIGRIITHILFFIQSLLNGIVHFCYRFLVVPVFEFLKRTLSRSIEYRCDRESAQAFGGKRMAAGLRMLGESNYFSIFSTHPNTCNRIKYVQDIQPRTSIITPAFTTRFSNLLSILLIVMICAYAGKKADINLLYHYYLYYIHSYMTDLLLRWYGFIKPWF